MAKTTATALPAKRRTAVAALTVAALGVVFGDIGTSPLYALKTVYSLNGFWAITLIVSVKYVALVMRGRTKSSELCDDRSPSGPPSCAA